MGTSYICKSYESAQQDHPHAYGDKRIEQDPKSSVAGSSPRVWGQDRLCDIQEQGHRIIPTRMGTSTALFSVTKMAKDHPHAYGDKMDWSDPKDRIAGSSPRVWGQALQALSPQRRNRIIPTRMGTRYLNPNPYIGE